MNKRQYKLKSALFVKKIKRKPIIKSYKQHGIWKRTHERHPVRFEAQKNMKCDLSPCAQDSGINSARTVGSGSPKLILLWLMLLAHFHRLADTH